MILALGLFFYLLLEHEIKHVQKNKKIRNNYLSFVHIVCCIGIYIIGNLLDRPYLFKSLMYANTGGFFINEVSFFIKEKKFTITRMTLILHHIFVLSMIINADFNTNIYFLLAAAEFTNIPGCILYHYIQKKKQLKLKDKDYDIPCEMLQKKIQAVVYIVIRVFISPYFIYRSLLDDKNILMFNKILSIPIYLLDVIWSIKLCKSYNKPI